MHVNIVNHFWRLNQKLIVEKSLVNCHAEGIDSVLFDDTPGARIRMFVAHENHTLYKNDGLNKMSLAIHPHHCDLAILPLKGAFQNITFSTGPRYIEPHIFNKFVYSSKIKNGKTGFVNEGKSRLYTQECKWYGSNNYLELKAAELHTIFIFKGQSACWMVFEGKEDANYKPICYSNADLTKFNDKNLYKKADKNYWTGVIGGVFPDFCG